jgi:enoyl-CoA hydratase/methylglutaconyl-CoA hydratase
MLVTLEVADRVATITLDSPHNRNALSRQLVAELSEHLASAGAAADVAVVLLRSAHPVFCSGADLSELASAGTPQAATAPPSTATGPASSASPAATAPSIMDGPRHLVALQRQLAALPRPVVIELGGAVRAGGIGLVGAADIVVAAESVTFALTEVRLGLAPAAVSLSLLARLDPRAAADTFLTGRTFDAREAARIGLVTRAVPDAELAAAVRAVLADLLQGSPQGLTETKRLLNAELLARIDRDGEDAARRSAELFASPQAQQAMLAFLSRRRS